MAIVIPFQALRPVRELAARICELPYDVLSSDEARSAAAGNPLSFFHVSKPEIDLDPKVSPYDDRVYAQGKKNFADLISTQALRRDAAPMFYLYRQIMGAHSQTGLVALTSCEEYLTNRIRKHELTRVEKEDDRVRHIEALNAQTGPAFLVYPADDPLRERFKRCTEEPPEIDFKAADGVRHSAWVLRDAALQTFVQERFAEMPAVYIADGHHRSAAAARVFQKRKGAGGSASFLSVLFPHDQVQILPYHRVLKDLNGRSAAEMLRSLEKIFQVGQRGSAIPASRQAVALYLAGEWITLRFRDEFTESASRLECLDVALLQKHVLAPIFGIDNPRTSERIQFVGGIRGTGELERLVNSGEFACAFAMFPTSIDELMAVADEGGIMPPKSTWFEPKLRDGMFCHVLD